MEGQCSVLYVTEEKKHLTVYSSPTFLFKDIDSYAESEMMSINKCARKIRDFYRKGRFQSLESFQKAMEELLPETMHNTDKVFNLCKKRNMGIRELLICHPPFNHRVYIYNGSHRELEILNHLRFVDLLPEGHFYYDGNYVMDEIPVDYQETYTTLDYDTKFYKDEILPAFYMKKYGITKEEMAQILDHYGTEMEFIVDGVFTSEEELARFWVTRVLEIEGEVLNCIDYKKYGKYMLEHTEDYKTIFNFGEKYVLCFQDEEM